MIQFEAEIGFITKNKDHVDRLFNTVAGIFRYLLLAKVTKLDA
jgi:hypothetical protein